MAVQHDRRTAISDSSHEPIFTIGIAQYIGVKIIRLSRRLRKYKIKDIACSDISSVSICSQVNCTFLAGVFFEKLNVLYIAFC